MLKPAKFQMTKYGSVTNKPILGVHMLFLLQFRGSTVLTLLPSSNSAWPWVQSIRWAPAAIVALMTRTAHLLLLAAPVLALDLQNTHPGADGSF